MAEAKEKRVQLNIPRIPGVKAEDVFIRVNGVCFQIPRGKNVNVPPYVKEEYERSLRAQERLDEVMAEHLYKDPQQNAQNATQSVLGVVD